MLSLPYNISCGYFDASEFSGLTYSPARTVARFELEFYTEDGEQTYVDGVPYKIGANSIQIAKPGQCRYSRLPFRTKYLKFSAQGTLAERFFAAPDFFQSSHAERVSALLDEIIILHESGKNEIKLYALLLSLFDLVFYDTKIPPSYSGEQYALIARARRFIEENAKEHIALADMARAVSLSPIYFHNLFTGATGKTPHDYLIACRVDAAKKMLWDTQLTLADVAERCGFGCQQYFNKVFKRVTGISPGKYRKDTQKNYYL